MRTLATKQPSQDSAKQKKQSNRGRSHSVSPLSTEIPLLQRKCACGGGCPRCQAEQDLEEALPIQTKLKISQPGDKYEQEADRIAEQVMRMPEPSLQRQAEPIEEEEEEETLQTKTTSDQPHTVSASIQNRITALQGRGKPLPQSERAFFEPRFGTDFSQVRVHTDSKAAETASAVNARAFTVGRDIVFGAGQYQPSASEGRLLLAHELTHVVQQKSISLNNNKNLESQNRPIEVLTFTNSPKIMRALTGEQERTLISRMAEIAREHRTSTNYAVIQILDRDDNILATGNGYVRFGHAEEIASLDIRRQVAESGIATRAPGTRMVIAVTNIPCDRVCQVELRTLQHDLRIRPENVELYQATRPYRGRSARGGFVSGVTAIREYISDPSSSQIQLRRVVLPRLSIREVRRGIMRAQRGRLQRIGSQVGIASALLRIIFAGTSQQTYARMAREFSDRRRQERARSYRIDQDSIGWHNIEDEIVQVFGLHPLHLTSWTSNDFYRAIQYLMRLYRQYEFPPSETGPTRYVEFESFFQQEVAIEQPYESQVEEIEYVFFRTIVPNRRLIERVRERAQTYWDYHAGNYLQRAEAAREAERVMAQQLENVAQGIGISVDDMMTIYDNLREFGNRYMGYVNRLHFTLEALDEAEVINSERFRRVERELDRIYSRERVA